MKAEVTLQASSLTHRVKAVARNGLLLGLFLLTAVVVALPAQVNADPDNSEPAVENPDDDADRETVSISAQSIMMLDVANNADECEFNNGGGGCTNTIGYWKNHAGVPPPPGEPDEISEHLPIWLGDAGGSESTEVTDNEMAKDILDMDWNGGHPSNGITKLMAQLLAAKLNISDGADPTAVQSVIDQADAFLTAHEQSDWSSLSPSQQQQVLAWAQTLDDYNNGIIGPGHCDDKQKDGEKGGEKGWKGFGGDEEEDGGEDKNKQNGGTGGFDEVLPCPDDLDEDDDPDDDETDSDTLVVSHNPDTDPATVTKHIELDWTSNADAEISVCNAGTRDGSADGSIDGSSRGFQRFTEGGGTDAGADSEAYLVLVDPMGVANTVFLARGSTASPPGDNGEDCLNPEVLQQISTSFVSGREMDYQFNFDPEDEGFANDSTVITYTVSATS